MRLMERTAGRLGDSALFGMEKMTGRRASVVPLTHDALVAGIKSLAGRVGLNPASYAGHSLRKCGATAAMRLDDDAMYIRMQRDWKSDCFERCCELDTRSSSFPVPWQSPQLHCSRQVAHTGYSGARAVGTLPALWHRACGAEHVARGGPQMRLAPTGQLRVSVQRSKSCGVPLGVRGYQLHTTAAEDRQKVVFYGDVTPHRLVPLAVDIRRPGEFFVEKL
ncbi:hypothetical protein CYMTET_55599 [Cymbomonas tetramitiformis]|uniref:Tyr recombinase domain-containing protein n=1 Tax=Cymbomonas tetramitiformis TaxID=36881 RepID=A0AAE0BDZ4_9CHLO|nr:hypothetical protein CYMTET_55599 [Cymbomonas tetramitiformis]